VVRIDRSSRCDRIVPETRWSGTARAVSHARNHEQPVETLNILGIRSSRIGAARKKCSYLLVEVNGVTRRNGRIAPTVILNQLATVVAECAQIGIV